MGADLFIRTRLSQIIKLQNCLSDNCIYNYILNINNRRPREMTQLFLLHICFGSHMYECVH